ncbi:DUF3105 domain-containing protein [Longispora albida]|uniref:DUF3105 domain-containing protein n=1 Tax=Longispora albida TaxID=203523 RepID=UPI001FDFD0BB|nr:DUF3105 domain-containing protein [Longispora albida]
MPPPSGPYQPGPAPHPAPDPYAAPGPYAASDPHAAPAYPGGVVPDSPVPDVSGAPAPQAYPHPPHQPGPGYTGQPGYPQQPGYPPFPPQPDYAQQHGYPYPGYALLPPPKKSRTGLIVGLVAGFVALLLTAAGVGTWLYLSKEPPPDLSAVVDYHKTMPDALGQEHSDKPVSYPMTPPVGGTHAPVWQNCMGDVYTSKIPSERAVHSLEHGAIWITYDPAQLSGSGLSTLAGKVRGTEYTFLSPFPGQKPKISLQAWGYQLAVDSPEDKRIELFIQRYRKTAGPEKGATCSGGSTSTSS